MGQKQRNLLLFMVSLLLVIALAPARSAPIPDRYQGEIPKIGYFGRMEHVLYSSDVTDTTIATNMLIKKIFGLMNMKAEIKLYENLETLKLDLSKNLIDATFVNIFDFFAMEHLVNPDYIYALILSPGGFEKTLLITRKKQQIAKLEDLQDLSISIPRGYLVGKYYLDLELMKRNLPKSEHYFSHINEVADINSAVIDLFFGKTDCALVTDIAFELASEMNKQISIDLEILLESTEMVPQVLALNKNISPDIFKQIDNYIINAHEIQRIKTLLSLFRGQKFVRLKKSQIQSSRKLLHEYQAMNKRSTLIVDD
jgi:hypothetical protein